MANKKKRNQNVGQGAAQRAPKKAAQQPAQRTEQRQRQQQTKRQPGGAIPRNVIVGIVAAVAVLAVAGLIVTNIIGSPSAPPSSKSAGQGSTKGSPDAKVIVDEYSDFQCPYCGQFALGTFPSIDKNYVETGKVLWTFKEFQRIGDESKQAGQAAECAGEQGKFWDYHDKLFFNQKGENQGTFSNSKLKGFASDLGLDRAAFDACLDSGRMASKLNQDYNEGMSKGVQATPTFFVKVAGAAGNGQKIEGAYPYSNFQAAIESALKQAQ